MSESPDLTTLRLLGGRLCLDFVNTIDGGYDQPQRDWLASYADLVAWSRHAGALDAPAAATLHKAGAQRPDAAAKALAAAVALRAALYRIFRAVSDAQPPPAAALATLNLALADAGSYACLVPVAGGFAWGWTPATDRLDRVLWPVVRSAAELLPAPDLARVRECAGDSCAWLFVDTSRNGSRRWCDMQDCGNKAKARRHYQRRNGSRIMPSD